MTVYPGASRMTSPPSVLNALDFLVPGGDGNIQMQPVILVVAVRHLLEAQDRAGAIDHDGRDRSRVSAPFWPGGRSRTDHMV